MRAHEFIIELKINDNDVRRIIKDRLAIDAETGIDAMKLAIDQMFSVPKTSYVQSQASQLMMLYKRAKMSIGGDYYRKLNKLTENVVTEKKRKRRKPRWAAYGPGPYGGYGYAVGYSGDSGPATGGDGGGAVGENFADGKNPQDKGDSARHGIPKNASIAQLKKIRSSDTASPRKKQLAHWQINMRQGRKKK